MEYGSHSNKNRESIAVETPIHSSGFPAGVHVPAYTRSSSSSSSSRKASGAPGVWAGPHSATGPFLDSRGVGS